MIETHPLWQAQLDLEQRMRDDGVADFQATLIKASANNRGADGGAGLELVLRLVGQVSTGVAEFLTKIEEMKRGRHHKAYPYLKNFDPDVAAFIAIKATLNRMGLSGSGRRLASLQLVAALIGRALEAEDMIEQFRRAHPKLVPAIIQSLDKTTSHFRHRRRVLMAAAHRHGFVPKEWGEGNRIAVGLKMVELLDAIGLFENRIVDRMHRVFLSKSTWEFLEKRNEYLQLLQPRLTPCIVPPNPWNDTNVGGGYWTNVEPKALTLVKSTYKQIKGRSKPSVSDVVREAVNAVQATPWVVNRRVLEVMQEVVARGLDDYDVLPPIKERELPARPADIDTNEVSRKEWRTKAAKVYSYNTQLRSRRLQVIKTLTVAEEFVGYERIYFPHQLDFRGRAYALPQWLTPQGPDYAKGLLMFAEGKPIGDEQGPGWLAIHGANCFGVDKVGLEDRIQWTEDNEKAIGETAADPLSSLWWTEADNPWQFLAFCFEWSAYRSSGGDPGFVSRLPVMVDGTCNGLQHYSAMLRDEVGGAATNLIPSDKPQDIYGKVAECVNDRLSDDAATTDHPNRREADVWFNFGIDRKITKRPVMVLPYGGTFKSCRSYVQEAVRERGCPDFGSEEENRKAIHYLATVVWDAIGDVVVAARAAMEWLQEITRIASHAGVKFLTWTTPAGFEVHQSYATMKSKIIKTTFHGSQIKLSMSEPSKLLDKRRQASGVPPNFVHSLDAAAMQTTIDLAEANGVSSFAMVHDSYGTTAFDMQVLSVCLREAFVTLYRDNDVLKQLRERVIESLPEKIRDKVPPLPARGSLDIAGVLQSDFFFA